jgi:cell division protein FtsQ
MKRKNRFKKKKKTDRARLRSRIGLAVRGVGAALMLILTSTAFIFAHDYFVHSRQFRASEIQVSGARRLDRQQVLAIAEIEEDANILAVNLNTARKRLLAQPWIAGAAVSRKIPSGLHLSITEEKALAILEMDREERYLLNESGRVFKRMQPLEQENLPRVQGLNHADLPVAGERMTESLEAVMTLLALAAKPGSPLPLSAIDRIQVDHEVGITVAAEGVSRIIKLGFGRYARKCRELGRLMARLEKKNRLEAVRTLDLFDVDRIVITLAATDSAEAEKKEV